MGTITLGVDLAKRVFSVCEMDAAGHVLRRQELKRDAFAAWLAQQPAGTIVAMEACSRAHHWAQRCLEHRLQPRLRRRRSERARSQEAFDPQRLLLSNAIPRGSDRSWPNLAAKPTLRTALGGFTVDPLLSLAYARFREG